MTKYKVAELDGAFLDAAVAKCKGLNFELGVYRDHAIDPTRSDPRESKFGGGPFLYGYCRDWAEGGPIIEADQIFLDPPHDIHRHGGAQPGWSHVMEWTATVSKRTRSYPNPNFLDKPGWPSCVGHGAGPTALIAAMRAVVASYGYTEIELP